MKKWFSGIRVKLLLVSVLSVVSLLIVGITGYTAISSLADKLNVSYNEREKLVENLGQIESGIHASFRWLWVSYGNDNNFKERQKFIEKTNEVLKEVDEASKNYLALPIVPEARQLFNQKFVPSWESSKIIFQEIISELKKNDSQSSEKAKLMIMTKLRQKLAPASETVDNLQNTVNKINKKIVTESMSYAHNAKMVAMLVVFVAGILCFVICLYIASKLVEVLARVSSELNSSSIQVSAAAEQIAASSEQLSQATVEQASSLEETSSSIQEISSMIARTSENAIQASKVSVESQQNALRGKAAVQDMIFSINEITDSNNNIMTQIDQSNKEISEIVKVIAEIGNKTKVINDIVFQTKLLSFNASVEAARAGENGKGFAVVAEEVGNLAQMSGKAAGEISEMLESSIKKVEGIVNDTKVKVERLIGEGKFKVDKGTEVARRCGDVLEEIVASISSVSEMANEIAISSQEQSQGVNEITKAMGQINVATQQNAEGASQSAASAEELSAQSSMLKNAVHSLIVTIEGSDTGVILS